MNENRFSKKKDSSKEHTVTEEHKIKMALECECAYLLSNINKSYTEGNKQELCIFSDLNLGIKKGLITGIIGESGSGKSTLLNIISTNDFPNSGTVYLETPEGFVPLDKKYKQYLEDYRLKKISFVIQEKDLIGHLNVIRNVMIPLKLKEDADPRKVKKTAMKWLDFFGIGKMASKSPDKLSGGERQRVSIARALANNTEIILADEPTGSLDPENSENIMNCLSRAASEFNKTVIVITHDQNLAHKNCDRIINLSSLSGGKNLDPTKLFMGFNQQIEKPKIEDNETNSQIRREVAKKPSQVAESKSYPSYVR